MLVADDALPGRAMAALPRLGARNGNGFSLVLRGFRRRFGGGVLVVVVLVAGRIGSHNTSALFLPFEDPIADSVVIMGAQWLAGVRGLLLGGGGGFAMAPAVGGATRGGRRWHRRLLEREN